MHSENFSYKMFNSKTYYRIKFSRLQGGIWGRTVPSPPHSNAPSPLLEFLEERKYDPMILYTVTIKQDKKELLSIKNNLREYRSEELIL